jgi:hypothetical protein
MEHRAEIFDSIYPDLLKTGLGKLGLLDARRELLALFSALEHFRRDLHQQECAEGILRLSQQYITGLNLFRITGFWLVNPADFGFEPALAFPEADQGWLKRVVDQEIRNGRFAWALRQHGPLFFPVGPEGGSERGMLHSLAVSSQVVGMFCGVLHRELAPNQEIVFSVLSLLLGGSADALATLRKTAKLASEIKTLNGLLPVCSWCKKVRDDRGYWEQLEHYVSNRSAASFTHGICPDCQKQWLSHVADPVIS